MRLRIVPLDPTLHDRGAFSCGNHRVDDYLRSTAAQAAKYFKAATFVLLQTDAEHKIFGFYTLLPHEYRDDDQFDDVMARALRVQNLQRIPMILLGQLGVATDVQGKGLGALLLQDALNRALTVAQEVGGVAVITDPYDERARAFYAKYAFSVLHEEPFVRMILPMRTLAQSIVKARAEALITRQGGKTKS
jgi:GNAT superfamily N-acetyltransferase